MQGFYGAYLKNYFSFFNYDYVVIITSEKFPSPDASQEVPGEGKSLTIFIPQPSSRTAIVSLNGNLS